MCTAIAYCTKDHYFGRNLDLEYSYNEDVIITPRNFPLPFRKSGTLKEHYAIIGMGIEVDGYPLYYDATNEMGLSMAGLEFPGNAWYSPFDINKTNITPFELIPWILGQCANITETKKILSEINILDEAFNGDFSLTPLHWMITDQKESIVVEAVKDGIRIYDNPQEVLTNNPSFDRQLNNLYEYDEITQIPGDLSSKSRFVRAVFIKKNSASGSSECESISQFFHILGSVSKPRGCDMAGEKYRITVYSSCCNTSKGIYYYKTYDNSHINGVDMFREDLEQNRLIKYHLKKETEISINN